MRRVSDLSGSNTHGASSGRSSVATRMKHEIRFKNLSAAAHRGLETLVASLAHKHCIRHFEAGEAEAGTLFTTLESVPRGVQFRATLRLELPGRTVVSRESGNDMEPAVENAFKELETRLRRHLASLNRPESQRPSGNRLPRLENRLPAEPRAELHFDRIQDGVAELASFVERELAYLRSSGELASDYPTIDDVVDEVLVRALDRWQATDAATPSGKDLLRLSIEVLAERVAEARTELLEGLAFDEADEVDPAQALYYQEQLADARRTESAAFEPLAHARTLPDPSDEVEFEQIRRLLLESLRLLPASWRRMVMLSQMYEQPTASVAETLGVDERTVHRCLEHADAFLRDRLQRAAIDLPDRAAPADYLVIDGNFSLTAMEVEQELMNLLEGARRLRG